MDPSVHIRTYFYENMSKKDLEFIRKSHAEQGHFLTINGKHKRIEVYTRKPGDEALWRKELTQEKINGIFKAKSREITEKTLLISSSETVYHSPIILCESTYLELPPGRSISYNYSKISYEEWLSLKSELAFYTNKPEYSVKINKEDGVIIVQRNEEIKKKTKKSFFHSKKIKSEKQSVTPLNSTDINQISSEKFEQIYKERALYTLEGEASSAEPQVLFSNIGICLSCGAFNERTERHYLAELVHSYLKSTYGDSGFILQKSDLRTELEACAKQNPENIAKALEQKIDDLISIYKRFSNGLPIAHSEKNAFNLWRENCLILHQVGCLKSTQAIFTKQFFELNLNILMSKKFPGIDCSNYQAFLVGKIGFIMCSYVEDINTRIKIINNIIINHQKSINLLITRIKTDENKIRKLFGITNFEIKAVEHLGDETHNKNMGPFHIKFEDGKSLIYKPRSMLAEQEIVGQNGLFSQIARTSAYSEWQSTFSDPKLPLFSIYPVLDKKDYGFCAFLKNEQTKNTIKKENIQEYVVKAMLFNRLFSNVGGADLHGSNVIMDALCLGGIDCEVVMIPSCPHYNTDFFENRGGFWCSKEELNCIWIEDKSHNSIPLKETLLREIKTSIDNNEGNRISKNDQEPFADKVHMDNIIETNTSNIQQCRDNLSKSEHRFVLFATEDLDKLLWQFTSKKEAFKEFCNLIQAGMEIWGGTFNPHLDLEAIRRKFVEDFMNNDTPIFSIFNNEIYYYDIKLGDLEFVPRIKEEIQ